MSTIYLDSNPMLQTLATRLFKYSGKRFSVIAAESVRCPSYWDEGNRSYWAEVRETGEAVVYGDMGGLFDRTPAPTITLTPHNMVLEHRYSRAGQSVTIYVHASRMPQFLPAGPSELSKDQKIVLSATRSLKSSYGGVKDLRYSEAHRTTGISRANWDTAKNDLISKGLLNRAGAITNDGRNAIGRTDLWELR